MKHAAVRVSDHAVVRYLERVRGVDIRAVRAEIAEVVALAEEHPGANGVRSGGHVYRIKNNTVVTVAPTCEANLRTHRGRS